MCSPVVRAGYAGIYIALQSQLTSHCNKKNETSKDTNEWRIVNPNFHIIFRNVAE